MSGRLTTHVLDLSRGIPATGLTLQLWKLTDGMSKLLCEEVTNSDGRLDAPLLEGNEMEAGCYELLFMVGDYYRRADAKASAAGIEVTESSVDTQREMSFFLEQIPIRFHIESSMQHYHVPLLVAPGGYSTYRGS
ncbi:MULTISPECIES: hydroxyisourate hydrolase [Paenibacillus]|uniref:hydroxyisourate hydrolase n=1 Tax=Paenibacillus TaxID=44249 RepID=UPI0004F5B013|nr:hydroxyisourate hydrolase [Paenibacillus odorifer]AIQ72950.1 5-hydroxyisourate hydrolase [Paenibacillus odorifer]MEC0130112.1 hydroxyisourate hydrolase [Paenibacillus odorifer]MEC0223039.1 hydroxyisourate hydrolase [Paenibacillus odorifer]OMC94151.1 hydroxyisourate hydrolase [Paenibacillus odorifer]OMD13890.1 hydroxyisourate hydrolase [Paenibacillus odorifer]